MMEPGPELDARLAEAMGLGVCRDPDCVGEPCPGTAMFRWGSGTWEYGEDGRRWSTDVGAAIEAAEKMRQDGKIMMWELASAFFGSEAAASVWRRDDREPRAADGISPAHAMTLALLAALEDK